MMTNVRFQHISFLSLGSNVGDRLSYLRYAIGEMKCFGDVKSLSRIYETEPWGYDDPSPYLNMTCRFDTNETPHMLKEKLSRIEKLAGRVKTNSDAKYSARTLDIDILLFDSLNINTPDLMVPHPRMKMRRFVLLPLSEIAPDIKHPDSGESMISLLQMTRDTSKIALYRNEL